MTLVKTLISLEPQFLLTNEYSMFLLPSTTDDLGWALTLAYGPQLLYDMLWLLVVIMESGSLL
jgi:hypothetical protein